MLAEKALASVLRSAVRPYGSIPGPIRLLALGVFINRLAGFFSTFLALILVARGVPASQIGVGLALVAISSIAGGAAAAESAEWIGNRWTIVLVTAGAAAVLVALSFVHDLLPTIALACCLAALGRAYGPAALAMLGRLAPPAERTRMFAFYRLAQNVGVAIGPVLGGFLLSRSLALLLLASAAASACFAVVALRLPVDGRRHRPGARTTARSGYAVLLRDRAFVAFCAAFLLTGVVYTQQAGVLPLTMHDRHLGPEVFGALLTANAAAVILLELPITAFVRRWRPARTVAAGAGLICAGFAVYWFPLTVVTLVLGAVGWTLGEMLMAPTSSSAAYALAPAGMETRYQAMLSTAQTIGLSVGPAAGIFVYSAAPSLPWIACAAVGVVVVVTMLHALRSIPPGASSTEGGGS
jgi:MFS family permease